MNTSPCSPARGESARDAVVERYSALARSALAGERIVDCDGDQFDTGCFGPGGYPDTTDLPEWALRTSLGCGNPLSVADLHPGDVVLDLGSGAGLDALRSAERVAPTGRVYGLDASPDMLRLARLHAAEAGTVGVEFLYGHIEDVPLAARSVDVVISNCVINLSADRRRVLAEVFRVLRPGGRLGVSDVVADDTASTKPGRTAAERQVGCVVGTWTHAEYRTRLAAAGFTTARVTVTHAVAPGLHSAIITATKS